MLLDPHGWAPAQAIERVLENADVHLTRSAAAETHAAALELATGIHTTVAGAVTELEVLRRILARQLEALDLRAASAGTHPLASWRNTEVSPGERYQGHHESMRELARREPSYALHVHVGIADAETAARVADRLRAHLPLLLALSANSPFWQGRDSGLASARTPIFQAFPRVGLPRRFGSYAAWVATVRTLVDAGAIADHTYLWWDVRLQPTLGTVEVRIMDAQTSLRDVAPLLALVQSVARLEAEEGYVSEELLDAQEVLAENRFLAARDGIDAQLVDPVRLRLVPARELVRDVVDAARPHASDLGCADQLDAVQALMDDPPAARQRAHAGASGDLEGVVAALSAAFVEEAAA